MLGENPQSVNLTLIQNTTPGESQKHLPDEQRTDRWLLPVLGRLVVVAGLAVSLVDVYLLGDKQFALPAVESSGFVLFAFGIALNIIARLTLGRFYSETVRIRPEHQLVMHGLYRFVRHPIYLGVLLFAVGAPLILGSLLGLIVMVALVPMLIIRIRLEERILAARFGNEYTKYAARTKRLIPFVY